jgi:hypothetical protein
VSESDLYPQILAAHSRANVRLFRQNAGLAWQGSIIEQSPHRLVLAHPRPVRLGVPGFSDLGGFISRQIGDELVAQYLALEIKSARGRATPEQAAFIDTVIRMGGRAGIARSVEEAGVIIRGEI